MNVSVEIRGGCFLAEPTANCIDLSETARPGSGVNIIGDWRSVASLSHMVVIRRPGPWELRRWIRAIRYWINAEPLTITITKEP